MDIQNNTNLNFRATRVLTATRRIKPQAPEIVDIFHLEQKNPNDVKFIRTCLQTIKDNCNLGFKNRKSITLFFEDFINDIKINGTDFFIAIKEGERIVGGYQAIPFGPKQFITKAFLNTEKKNSDFVADSFSYNFLSDARKTIPKLDKDVKNSITGKLIGLNLRNPDIKFVKNNERKEEDLLEFMGINEFESQLIKEIPDDYGVSEWLKL